MHIIRSKTHSPPQLSVQMWKNIATWIANQWEDDTMNSGQQFHSKDQLSKISTIYFEKQQEDKIKCWCEMNNNM